MKASPIDLPSFDQLRGSGRCPVKAALDYIASNDPLVTSKNPELATVLKNCNPLTNNQWRWVAKFINAHSQLMEENRSKGISLDQRLKELHRLKALILIPELKSAFSEGQFRTTSSVEQKMKQAYVEKNPMELFQKYNNEISQLNAAEKADRKKVYGGLASPGFVYDSVFEVRQISRRGTLDQDKKTTLLLAEFKDALDLGLFRINSSYSTGGSRSNDSPNEKFIVELEFDKSQANDLYGNRFQELTQAGKISLVYVPSKQGNSSRRFDFKGISLWGGVYKHSPTEKPKAGLVDSLLRRKQSHSAHPNNGEYNLDYPMLFSEETASEKDMSFIKKIRGLPEFIDGLGNLPPQFWQDQNIHAFDLEGINPNKQTSYPEFVELVQQNGYSTYHDFFIQRLAEPMV